MRKKVTISLDEKLVWMLRNKQTEMMLDKNKQISISAVVNNVLFKVLKVDEMISGELHSVLASQN